MKKIFSTILLATILLMFVTISWATETDSNGFINNLGQTVLSNDYTPVASTDNLLHNLGQKIFARTGTSTQKVTIHQAILIPYNIEGYGFLTGIHIAIGSKTTQQYVVGFTQGLNVYAAQKVTIPASGWTGLVSDLLPSGITFRSPSMLMIIAPEGALDFFADQFLFTGGGFSHVVFHSKPVPINE